MIPGYSRVEVLIALGLSLLLELTLHLCSDCLHHHVLRVDLIHRRGLGVGVARLWLLVELLLWRDLLLLLRGHSLLLLLKCLRLRHHHLLGHHLRLSHGLALRWELEHTSVVWIGKVCKESIHTELNETLLLDEILNLEQIVAHLLSLLQKLFFCLHKVSRELARLQGLPHTQLLLQLCPLYVWLGQGLDSAFPHVAQQLVWQLF